MKRLTYLSWIIMLYKPDWMLGHYFSFLSFLPRFQIFILLTVFLSVFFASKDRSQYKYLLPFLCICTISLIFAQNTGAGRPFLKLLFQYYMLSVISLSYLKTFSDLKILGWVILFHFLYYNIWGILHGGIVTWHTRLNESNAFGPYSVYGIAFSFFYSFNSTKIYEKIICFSNIAIGLANVAITFTMGSFISLLCLGAYVFLVFPRKIRALVLLSACSMIFFLGVNIFIPDPSKYWDEMARLKSDTESSNVGGERLFLWKIAFREFLDNPLFGVGLNNFGIRAPGYTTDTEISSSHVSFSSSSNIWGFALHNSHLQVLTEMGIVGFLFYIYLFWDYFKKNIFIRKNSFFKKGEKLTLIVLKNQSVEYHDDAWKYAVAMALNGCAVVYLICGTFYGLLFYPDIWILFIYNTLLFSSIQFSDNQYSTLSNSARNNKGKIDFSTLTGNTIIA